MKSEDRFETIQDYVQARASDLGQLTFEEVVSLPEMSEEEMLFNGHRAVLMTWHESKPDGSHWVIVEAYEQKGGMSDNWLAASGVAFSTQGHRELTPRELAR